MDFASSPMKFYHELVIPVDESVRFVFIAHFRAALSDLRQEHNPVLRLLSN